ncbi:Adenosylmethionine-8-amino-7-oxononanoate aminotransferase [Bosea sp. OK403]|jgi:adenosylmethionine-8-amino-7-oxononanoate aminotransferase|uniref:aspartate aminotransferase family protein n=1 Tax=Bosea sp. OK403 TaxID=1855286 RepID=UPI0008E3E66C|nr:aspartate aminotransferase family protein [Bosea sp. OK403]SFJ70482.1 Adenosylmethionine-8-amino-7-oxononanoate aminotransferase [Bosea sp. OK403]
MTRLLHRSPALPPPVAAESSGILIRTADGRAIIDAAGGAAVSCLGHGHPAVIAAVREQVGKLAYVHSGAFSSAPAEELAECLVGHEPGGLSHAYFVSSGSEACEGAFKLARQYFLEVGQPGRTHFIARRQSYHGNTLGALAAGGNAGRRAPYAPLLPESFSHVSAPNAYRRPAGTSEADFVDVLEAELEAEFQRLGPASVAGFVAETVIGATAGAIPAPAGYLAMARRLCDRHGALLILDEVMCGMGRTGTTHAWEQDGASPDLQTIAKGLGGGYQPIAAVLMREPIFAAIRAGSGRLWHGHTYMNHPVACAAALAVQRTIASEGLLDRVQAMGEWLSQRLNARFGNHPHVGDIRGRGLIQAIELVSDRSAKEPFDPALRLNERVKQAAFDLGLACYPSGGTVDGVRGDHVLLAPPYIVTAEEIDRIVEILGEAVDLALAS